MASARSFPDLEPQTVFPVSTVLLGEPLRRDILWRAVVFEADASRVGSSNTRSRAEMGYSNKKLRPQKGSGKARMGSRGSPTRHDGGRAFARHAPFDWSTDLPRQIYFKAIRVALSHIYRQGRLFVLDDGVQADFVTSHSFAGKLFVAAHGKKQLPTDLSEFEELPKDEFTETERERLAKRKASIAKVKKNTDTADLGNVLVIPTEFRENLHEATAEKFGTKIEIIPAEAIEVRDLLKAHTVIVEKEALKFLGETFQPDEPIPTVC